MTGSRWTKAETDDLVLPWQEFRLLHPNRTWDAYHCRRQRVKAATQKLPELPYDRPPDPIALEGDSVILSDLHLPFYDRDFTMRVLELADLWGIPNALLPGDVMEFEVFSMYMPLTEFTAEDAVDVALAFFAALGHFKERIYLLGNHDKRLQRFIQGKLRSETLARIWTQPGVKVSALQWCTLETEQGTWRISHPKSRSVIPVRVPYFLAAKYQSHIASGHGHRWGLTVDISGTYWCVDTGICAEPELLRYDRDADSVFPKMAKGALIIRDGYPWLLSPKSDWARLKKL